MRCVGVTGVLAIVALFGVFAHLSPSALTFMTARESGYHTINHKLENEVPGPASAPAVTVPAQPRIPRIMHFVHISADPNQSSRPLPRGVEANIRGWGALHPSWTVMVWTNELVKERAPHLHALFQTMPDQNKMLAWRADLLRYHVLAHYGGVYLDTDIVGLRSLEPLVDHFDSFTVCEEPRPRHFGAFESSRAESRRNQPVPFEVDVTVAPGNHTCSLVNNAVIGTTRNSEALHRMFAIALGNTITALAHAQRQNKTARFTLQLTGPPAWTTIVFAFNITILHPHTFFPCNWNLKGKYCSVDRFANASTPIFAMHTWSNSWH
jgi:hypothetical protein